MKGKLTKKSMNDLPEKYREALFQKQVGFLDHKGKIKLYATEELIDLYNSIRVDDTLYLKDGYKWPEDSRGFKLALTVHAIIMDDYILKNRYGYDGKI